MFSLAAAAVAATLGDGDAPGLVLHALREIGGALVLGAVLGVAAGLLTQRVQPGQPTLLEAAGIVLLSAGLATLLEVSFILTAMILGAVMTNVAHHHDRAFYEIEHLEWPFMVLFFVGDPAAARDRLDRRLRAARARVHAPRPAPRRRGGG